MLPLPYWPLNLFNGIITIINYRIDNINIPMYNINAMWETMEGMMETKGSIGKCPVCRGNLRITEYSCPTCTTKIVTDLPTCEFCSLGVDLARFLRVFLAARGNIRDVEREMGISYPTVRKRLDDLLTALGLTGRAAPSQAERLEVLERLSRGEINVAGALDALGGEAGGPEAKA